MPGPGDIQITIAQQVSTSYQQQLHQQQPIVHQEHQISVDKAKAHEAETGIQSLEKGASRIKIEEKRTPARRFIIKRRKRKEKKGEKEEMVSNGIRGKIIDVLG